jgi:hypothetical protein
MTSHKDREALSPIERSDSKRSPWWASLLHSMSQATFVSAITQLDDLLGCGEGHRLRCNRKPVVLCRLRSALAGDRLGIPFAAELG